MRRQFPGRHDVLDRPIANHEIVRDDSPMASPPQSFRTHVSRPVARGGVHQFAQAIFKIPTLRVVCVRSECGKLPRSMRRVVALRTAPAAELLDPSIFDVRAPERRGEFRLVELRPSLRAGERSHVGDDCDAMFAEQFEKALDRMRRVSDRENQRRRIRLTGGPIARLGRRLLSPAARF